MGALFTVSRPSHGQSTSADSITIDVPAGRKLKVHGAKSIGGGTAVAALQEQGIFRTTANGSGGTPTSLVLKPLDPNGSVPSGFTAKYGYGTQPTIEADPVVRLSFQPLGGGDVWPPVAGAPAEFWAVGAYQVSLRGIVGTGNVANELLLELE